MRVRGQGRAGPTESWNHFLSSPPCPGGSSAQFKLVRKYHPQDGSSGKYVKNKTDRFALNCSVSASLRSRWASRLRGTRAPWDLERTALCTGTRQACPWGPWLWPLLSRRAPESNTGQALQRDQGVSHACSMARVATGYRLWGVS